MDDEYCPFCDDIVEHVEEFVPHPEFEDELELLMICIKCENIKE